MAAGRIRDRHTHDLRRSFLRRSRIGYGGRASARLHQRGDAAASSRDANRVCERRGQHRSADRICSGKHSYVERLRGHQRYFATNRVAIDVLLPRNSVLPHIAQQTGSSRKGIAEVSRQYLQRESGDANARGIFQ